MNNKHHFFLFIAFLLLSSFKNDRPAYQLFDKLGKTMKYEKLVKACLDADVVLFGEYHDNPISHWLQFELTRDLYRYKGDKLILGAEMFESDNQLLLDEYLTGLIYEKRFEAEMRLWPNYQTDYKPLIDFAWDEDLKFVATNVPRRYASRVNSKGFEGLDTISDEAKKYIAPLPILYDSTLNCYQNMLEMGNSTNSHYPKAQALKDATMAHFIYKNLEPGKLFLHYHGAYHSLNYEGIYWYLKQAKADIAIVNITTVVQSDVSKLEEKNKNTADFVICVDKDMTKTR